VWLVCLVGSIATGKTAVATALHERLPGSAVLAFGHVVRRRAAVLGYSLDRASLQAVGQQLVDEGWPAFVQELLAGLSGSPQVLIVEGIRHLEAVEALRAVLPDRQVILVYVTLSEQLQRERLKHRDESDAVLVHPIERGVTALREHADLVIRGDRPLRELVADISELLA
jgi:dephospho-CoA kinase